MGSNLVDSAFRSVSPSQTNSEPVTTDEQIVEVWKRMASVYGHKWTNQYGLKVDPTWRRAMQSLPIERLKMALARCTQRKDGWPPSLTEFVALAEVWPEELGAPEADNAFREACHGAYPYNRWHKWSHKCVYWAAVWTGMSDLAERGERMRSKFNDQYQQALNSVRHLDDPPTGQLPERPAGPVEPDLEGEGYLSFKAELRRLTRKGKSE